MPNVIYLMALENVVNNAIFENQVKKLLIGLKREHGDSLKLTLLVLLPWIELTRRGPYSNFRRYRNELNALADFLASEEIQLVIARTLFPSAFFQMKIFGFFWFILVTLPVVWFQILIARAQIVHCRFYYATAVAMLASRLSIRRVRVIFDVRTLWPEQGIVNDKWKKDSLVFRFWKKVEMWLLLGADKVVSVAPAMTQWIRSMADQINVETIPNFVDLEIFNPNSELRLSKRAELGISDRKILVYSGALGGRYPADRMAACVRLFFNVYVEAGFFLVLSSSDDRWLNPLADELDKIGLNRGKHWQSINAPATEVADYLNVADWSLLVLGDFLTSETFLPIKFAEYLAMGLPVLTHPANSGIVEIVDKYNIGRILDPGCSTHELSANIKNSELEMKENCLATARKHFSLESFILCYGEIYRELTGVTH